MGDLNKTFYLVHSSTAPVQSLTLQPFQSAVLTLCSMAKTSQEPRGFSLFLSTPQLQHRPIHRCALQPRLLSNKQFPNDQDIITLAVLPFPTLHGARQQSQPGTRNNPMRHQMCSGTGQVHRSQELTVVDACGVSQSQL